MTVTDRRSDSDDGNRGKATFCCVSSKNKIRPRGVCAYRIRSTLIYNSSARIASANKMVNNIIEIGLFVISGQHMQPPQPITASSISHWSILIRDTLSIAVKFIESAKMTPEQNSSRDAENLINAVVFTRVVISSYIFSINLAFSRCAMLKAREKSWTQSESGAVKSPFRRQPWYAQLRLTTWRSLACTAMSRCAVQAVCGGVKKFMCARVKRGRWTALARTWYCRSDCKPIRR